MLLRRDARSGVLPVWKIGSCGNGCPACSPRPSALLALAGSAQAPAATDVRPACRSRPGRHAQAPAPEKTHTLYFSSANWDDVLSWFSKESGLTPILTVKPTGSVDIKPPMGKKFTMGEVVDLLNEAMAQQKFILIRRQVTFYIHPSDEKIDAIGRAADSNSANFPLAARPNSCRC